MRNITKFTKILAVVAGVGLLAGAAQAGFNWADTTTRPILIDSEGLQGLGCRNLFTNPPLPPTCNPNPPFIPPCPNHPNNRAPDPVCLDFANSSNADWSDPTNNYFGTATYLGGPTYDWNIYVAPDIYATVLQRTVGQSSAAITSVVRSLNVDIDINATGIGSVVPADPSGEYYRSTLLFGGVLNLDLYGQAVPNDNVWFGQTDNPLVPDPEQGVPLTFSCAGTPPAVAVCGPFTETAGGGGTLLTDAAANFATCPIQPLNSAHVVSVISGASAGATTDIAAQTTTTLSTAGPGVNLAIGDQFVVYNVASAFGPPLPLGAQAALCTTLLPEPGYGLTPVVPGQTVLTSFVASKLDISGTGPPATPATASNFAPNDWLLDEAPDTDADGIPDAFDNCINRDNGPTQDSGAADPLGCYQVKNGLFGTPVFGYQLDGNSDGYGNACDGDFNNDGLHTGGDVGPLVGAIGASDPRADMNCDGLATGGDVGPGIAAIGVPPGPGPSGLWCAGVTTPCVF